MEHLLADDYSQGRETTRNRPAAGAAAPTRHPADKRAGKNLSAVARARRRKLCLPVPDEAKREMP